MKTKDKEVKKQLLLLIAYQLANITMVIGFLVILFLMAQRIGIF